MKVKIKNVLHDSDKEPILLILSAQDRLNIIAMLPASTNCCFYPEGFSDDRVTAFMDESPKDPKYVEPPIPAMVNVAKKLVEVYRNNIQTIRATMARCGHGDSEYPVVCNQEVLLRILLEKVFGLTLDEAEKIARGF